MANDFNTRAPSGFLTFVVGIAGLALFALIVGTWIKGGARHENAVETERGQMRAKQLEVLHKDEEQKLQATAWVDQGKGVVKLPIEVAMQAVLADLKAKKATASQVKVIPGIPVFPADPNSKEPPPAPLPSAPQGADLQVFPPSAPAPTSAQHAPSAAPLTARTSANSTPTPESK